MAATSPHHVEPLEPRAYLSSVALAPATEFGGVVSPAGIAATDFNGNGIPDVAVVGIDPNTHLHTVAVYLDGAAAPVYYDLASDNSAQYILTGDFNNDGYSDIAVSDPVDGTVSVLLGNGNGTFEAPVTTRYGTAQPAGTVGATAYLATADFNVDGDADLAVTDPADHQISILLGNGQGGFTLGTPNTSSEASFDPQHIVAGEFNGSSETGLAYNDGTNPDVYVAAGNNDGTFAAPVAYAVNGAVQGLATGDLNGDEEADIVASVITGSGTGEVDTLESAGSTFSAYAPQVTTFNNPGPVVIGDINGDGQTDIATLNSSGALNVFLNIGGGYFASPISLQATSGSPQAATTADVNNDGKGDILFSEANTTLANGGGFGVVPGASAPEVEPALAGALPASAISGVKTSIAQTLRLTNVSDAPVDGNVTVDVALSTDASFNSDDTVIHSFTLAEKIAVGKSKAQRFKLTSLLAGLTPGNYYLVVNATDPNGGFASTSSTGTIDIMAPEVDLSGTFKKAPASARAGKGLNASITVTNTGNVPASGLLPIVVDASLINTYDGTAVQLLAFSKKINLKPHKSVTIPLSRLIAPATANDYYLIIRLDPNNTLNETNTASNTFATGIPIVVS